MFEFTSPAAGGGETVKPAEVEGHLLVVEPIEYRASVATSFGDKDAIIVNVHDIHAGTSHESVMWFSGALVGSLKNRIGTRVLAVMGKGTAKPGQAAPWVLQDASAVPAAVEAATKYLTGQVADSMTAPAAAAANPGLDAALANLAAAGLTK